MTFHKTTNCPTPQKIENTRKTKKNQENVFSAMIEGSVHTACRLQDEVSAPFLHIARLAAIRIQKGFRLILHGGRI